MWWSTSGASSNRCFRQSTVVGIPRCMRGPSIGRSPSGVQTGTSAHAPEPAGCSAPLRPPAARPSETMPTNLLVVRGSMDQPYISLGTRPEDPPIRPSAASYISISPPLCVVVLITLWDPAAQKNLVRRRIRIRVEGSVDSQGGRK